jgi:Putative Actinobacterial Holin-X, holin superfamily III
VSAGSEAPGSARHSPGSEANGAAREGAAGIATALADISERATLLIHEEIELAKAEVSAKVTRIARGAIVSVVAGVFIVTAVMFALVGCAWLLYYYLPLGSQFTYFWGFFAMAVILAVLGILAGVIAARVLRSSTPPVPEMAIEEARKIRETVSNGSDSDRQAPPAWSGADAVDQTPLSTVAPAGPPVAPAATPHASSPPPDSAPMSDPPPMPAPPAAPEPAPVDVAVPPPASAVPPAATIDEAALQADPAADASDASRVPTDELGPPAEPPAAGDDMQEAS